MLEEKAEVLWIKTDSCHTQCSMQSYSKYKSQLELVHVLKNILDGLLVQYVLIYYKTVLTILFFMTCWWCCCAQFHK